MSDFEIHADNADPQDDAPDIKKYENHFALAGKNRGCSGELLGKVCLVGFLVHDRTSAWSEESVRQMETVLDRAAFLLKEKSNLSDNRLQITYAFDAMPIQYKYDRENFSVVARDVLEQYGYKDAGSYQTHYKKKFKKSEAPLIFFINRDFRSFALKDDSEQKNPASSEYSFVSFSNDPDSCVRTLMHEVLHQFGAIDYYLPERVKTAAEQLFPESIMLHGTEIDDLTRYLIGWDKTPSDAVFQFLEETASVTQEEIDEARENDRDNDW